MSTAKGVAAFAVFCILFLASLTPAVAYTMPEILRYDLTWSGIKAGEAVLEVRDGGQDVQIISRATSTKFVSMFFRVEDLVTSTLRKGQGLLSGFWGLPQNYRMKIREGKHRKDKETIFDHQAQKINYINHLDGEKADFDLDGPVLDPLSCFYYIRQMPLEVGKPVYVEVFDNKQRYRVEVQVLRRETIETSLGTFNTILIKPVMKSEGIFSRKGDILIWLTDDEKRLPVQLKTKVPVGAVKATLTGGRY